MCKPEDFELGEDVTDLFRAPREQREQSGVVVSVRFSRDEATALLNAAEFHERFITDYVRDQVLKAAYLPQTKMVTR